MALNARLFGAETVDVETDQWNGTCDTFSLVTANLNKFTLNGYRVLTTQDLPFSPGVGSMAPVGNAPNANAGLISGGTLTLEPASSSFPGVVTTGTQTFSGAKTFTNNIVGNGSLQLGSVLQLPSTSSSSVGNINQGGAPILHTYGTNSVWVGTGAGQGFTQTGSGNTAMGSSAMQGLTTGNLNCAVGYTSGQQLTTGNYNTMVGANSGKALSIGIDNCIFGLNAAQNATSMGSCIVIGANAGQSFGSETNAVCIDPDQTAGFLGSNSVNIGSSAATKCRIGGIYNGTIDASAYHPVGIDNATQQLGIIPYGEATDLHTTTLDSGTITTMTVRGVSATQIPLILKRNGSLVSLQIPNFSITAISTGTPGSINFTGTGSIPALYTPLHSQSFVVKISNNGTLIDAVLYVQSTGFITLQGTSPYAVPVTNAYDYLVCYTVA